MEKVEEVNERVTNGNSPVKYSGDLCTKHKLQSSMNDLETRLTANLLRSVQSPIKEALPGPPVPQVFPPLPTTQVFPSTPVHQVQSSEVLSQTLGPSAPSFQWSPTEVETTNAQNSVVVATGSTSTTNNVAPRREPLPQFSKRGSTQYPF